MFKSLVLTNFRKHESLRLDFEQGLIAIRGRNEAGKTTIQEAIAYAMFGAKALRQSFDEVVTWGKPEASLAVELELTVGIRIRRSKRGAEVLASADRLIPPLCTGQSECTRYVEQMLGTNAATAAKLMLASQGALRGALEGGPTEAAALIEHLADFDLIDRVVDLIQHHLVTGNTAAAEETVKEREAVMANLDAVEAPDLAALDGVALALNRGLGEAYEQQKAAAAKLQELDLAGARRFMVDLAAMNRDATALAGPIIKAKEQAEVQVAVPDVSMEQIEDWRAEIMALKDVEARRQAYKALNRLVGPDPWWDGDKDSFVAEWHSLAQKIEARRRDRVNAQLAQQRAIAQRIRETQCAFCGKDLTDVPEVVRRNVEADAEVQAQQGTIDSLDEELASLQATYDEMTLLQNSAMAYEQAVHRFGAFVTLDTTKTYPCTWTWNGAVPSDDPTPDYNAMIRVAEAQYATYQRALGQKAAAESQLAVLRGQQAVLLAKIGAAEQEMPAVAERIRNGEVLEARVAELGREIERLKTDLHLARAALDAATARAQEIANMREVATIGLQRARQTLDEMRFNNALVKKVRGARAVISDKLWSVVLAAVGHHFSLIRGTQSVITRSDSGFLCDGKAVQGLSGSTLDALGLAIRVALTKTFLPNSRFLLLDEPGSAADDERESNMLGLLAASDFDQTLLITHSALADSFASQVISL